MILGAYRDKMHEIKVSLDGFTIRRSQSSHPSLEYLSGLYDNRRKPESTICTHHMSYIQNASLSHALLLQADQGTAQLQLLTEPI